MKSTARNQGPPGIEAVPAVLQQAVLLWLERFAEQSPEQQALFVESTRDWPDLWRLVACSEFAAKTVLRDWRWFREAVLSQRAPAGLGYDASQQEADAGDLRSTLRCVRNRRMLQILWREVAGETEVYETLDCLSTLADQLIRASVSDARCRLVERYGVPRDEHGNELHFTVLAMGKLGGMELNFSSDVDLIFLYSGNGESDGPQRLSAQEYFSRLARHVVTLLDEVTPDGFVYRVDTRLRPFGDSGPPVVSYGALESYLVRHGRDWERYAYIKARVVDTGVPVSTVTELMQGIVEPFVYRRYLDYGVFESLREMKALVSAEARKKTLASNLKLGPGGIREIEFIVQSLQLVRGGSDRKLRTTGLKAALRRLGRTHNLQAHDAAALADDYAFLRRLENAVQALRDQQEHETPVDPQDQARVALALGYPDWPELSQDLRKHRANAEQQFAAVAFRGNGESARTDISLQLASLWNSDATADDWEETIRTAGVAEARSVAEGLLGFRRGTAVRQIGKTGGKRLERFMPDLVLALANRAHPGLVLERVLGMVEQILRRSAYVALLNENPLVLDRLVGLCASSAWLAEEIGRYPVLLDELLDPRLYTTQLTREEMQAELDWRFEGLGNADSERRIEILAQFKRAVLFRIAVADISGGLPIMKVSDRLTELAEIVLDNALSIAWADLVEKHGKPRSSKDERLCDAGFGVVAYGKFGGMELSYRSDLDLVFLHDSAGADQHTVGDRPLENSMFFARLVRRVVHFLNTRTAAGVLYQVDTRLRPSGRSGLLVIGLEGFERYQVENAWTWEHQALLRSRPVAGSATVCREFERIRSQTLRKRVKREKLRGDVIEMRNRMRAQLDRSSNGRFDLKQGVGGIGDIEFIVQYLVLANADSHPAVIHYPDNIRQLGVLGAAGCLGERDVIRLQEIYKNYRFRLHHLALDEQAPEVDEGEFVEERAFVGQMWDTVMQPAVEAGA